MKYLTPLLLAMMVLQFPLHASDLKRQKIGQVLDKPVYRDQITATEKTQQGYKLHALFIGPIMKQFYETHKRDLDPTQAEIDKFLAYYRKKHTDALKDRKAALTEKMRTIEQQLKDLQLSPDKRMKLESERYSLEFDLTPPGEDFAWFVLPHWKLQIYLYKNFGGGRLLWQQRGIEAFDAMHKWLKLQELEGRFTISDPKMKNAFYYYWRELNKSALFIEEPRKIEREFLNPEWKRL